MDAVPPARPVEMITQSASGAGQPWAPWKVALELASGLGGSDLIDLGGVIVLYH